MLSGGHPRNAASAQPNILIIEDDSLLAAAIADVLTDAGFGVTGIAATLPEALSLARKRPCAVALIDIGLPGPEDGIAIAGELRRRFDVGAVFLSGTSDPYEIARTRQVLPYAFLQKPFLPSKLFKTLESALQQREIDGGAPRGIRPH